MAAALSISDALFGRTRRAVLGLLFGNPGRAYYIREIVQAAGRGASQVQVELERLTRAGLVTRERRANQVYFQANPNAAVFPELTGLVAKTFGIAEFVRQALEPNADRIRLAFVYGSVARNEHHATSDVDVLVVGDVLLSELDEGIRTAEQRLGRSISVTLLDTRELSRRIKAKDHFLRSIVSGPKILLFGDVALLTKPNGRRAR